MKTDLFASIVANLSDGIYVMQHGKAIFLNERFCEMFGYRNHEELIGRDMFATVYPDRQSVDLFRKIHDQVLAGNTGKIAWGQPSAKVDGTPFWIEVEARLIEVQGEPAIFGTFLDRTDCKMIGEAMHASQETLRLLLDAMEDRVYVVTDDYRLVYANRKMKAGLIGDIEKDYCYKICRGLDAPCIDCSTEKVFVSEHPLQKEYLNQVTNRWYSVIELPVRMPGIDRPTKLAVARDITERRAAEEKIRALSHRLLSVQEHERKHLSRELHDDLGQRLNAAKIAIDLLAQDLAEADGDIATRLSQLSQVMKGTIESVRHLSAGLRPASLERLGLVGAIRNDCEQFSLRYGLKAEFTHHGMETIRLGQEAEINLYRVMQEALNNVVKHASASEVSIQLVASHPIVRMRIKDDGRGFTPACRGGKQPEGLGLVGMTERMDLLRGSFKIRSSPGKGTLIAVEIPITEEAAVAPVSIKRRGQSNRAAKRCDEEDVWLGKAE